MSAFEKLLCRVCGSIGFGHRPNATPETGSAKYFVFFVFFVVIIFQ